jgi:uncharacterized protein
VVEEITNLEDRRFYCEKDMAKLQQDYLLILNKLKESLESNTKLSLGKFEGMLRMIHTRRVKHYPCGVCRNFFTIAANGAIYSCHRFVGRADWKIGNVEIGFTEKKTIQLFLDNYVENKSKCKECWARHWCGGECPFNSFIFSKDIKYPNPFYCNKLKFSLKEAIFLYSSLPKRLRKKFVPKELKNLSKRKRYYKKESKGANILRKEVQNVRAS